MGDGWRDRFTKVLEEKNLDMKEISLKAKRGETFIRDMLKRNRSPSIDNLAAACHAVGIPLSKILGEYGEAITELSAPSVLSLGSEEYTAVGRYDAAFSAGPGSLVESNPEPLGYHLVQTQWLRVLSRASPENLAVVRVDGDSMQPTLWNGDWVLIDKTQQSIAREGIYAIQVFDRAWIKRLSLNLRGKVVRILSDNPVVPPQEEAEENLTVIGRVVALVSRSVA